MKNTMKVRVMESTTRTVFNRVLELGLRERDTFSSKALNRMRKLNTKLSREDYDRVRI